ncbi:hypothetical protein T492DRAFT_914017 [Pavlovales sp. CCMP2436]|nr:hypothetical protein T492DRAFT_914017 [Pavlovales sp. CCMP2436]
MDVSVVQRAYQSLAAPGVLAVAVPAALVAPKRVPPGAAMRPQGTARIADAMAEGERTKAELSRSALLRALAASALALAPRERASGATYELGLTAQGALRGCPRSVSATSSGCVSSAASAAPNQFVSPLSYEPSIGREGAFRRLKAGLLSRPGAVLLEARHSVSDVVDSERYLHARVPSLDGSFDEVELQLLPGEPVVTLRVISREPVAIPPFCVTRGCIAGNNSQRDLLEQIRAASGLANGDDRYENEKKWVPIWLHGG